MCWNALLDIQTLELVLKTHKQNKLYRSAIHLIFLLTNSYLRRFPCPSLFLFLCAPLLILEHARNFRMSFTREQANLVEPYIRLLLTSRTERVGMVVNFFLFIHIVKICFLWIFFFIVLFMLLNLLLCLYS